MALTDHLAPLTRVPIAELQPSVDASNSCIKGMVALIWPYSSSKRSLSLLLAEPDFRLRRQKGQIRVTFTGSSAKLVAGSGVTSGDGLVLGLVGVQWAKDESTIRTPGEGSEWELRFGERAILQIDSEAKALVSLNIDHPTLSPDPQVHSLTPPRSPTASEIPWVPNRRSRGRVESQVWSSPAFLKRSRLTSATYFRSTYNPFFEEDEYLEGIGRKRTKFGRESGQWRYTERTPSPEREAEAAIHEANQHELLGPADERMETFTALEGNRDLQESTTQERDVNLVHQPSLRASVKSWTSDIGMRDDSMTAKYETAEEQSSMVGITENQAIEGPGVRVSQHDDPTGLSATQWSLSAGNSPIAREELLAAERVEDTVAAGRMYVVVESGPPNMLPDDHMYPADAVHEHEHLLPQLDSPSSPRSPSVSPTLDRKGDASLDIPRFDEQLEKQLVSDDASRDDYIGTAARAYKPSISARTNQREVNTLGAGTDTLNVNDVTSGFLPGDPPIRHISDLATNDNPFGSDGGAFSQPMTGDVTLGDRWDDVAAAYTSLENPRGGSESSSSPSSHHFDMSPIKIGDDVAQLTTLSDGHGGIVPSSQATGAVAADYNDYEFPGSSAMNIKGKTHHDLSSPQILHAVDVEENSLSSHGSEDEEDDEEEYSEDELDEREDMDENSEDWTEGSEGDSIQLEEYSSSASDEPEVNDQVPLAKPPIEIIDLEDDDEEAENSQSGLDGPYNLSVPDVLSTDLAPSVASRMLKVHGRGQDILSENREPSQVLVADDVDDEDALSVDSDSSQILGMDEDHGEDVLSRSSEPFRVLEADEARGGDALSTSRNPSEVIEVDEAPEEDLLPANSEPSLTFRADEGPEEDVLSVNSKPSPAFEADEAHEDVLSVGSKSSPAVEADEAPEEDVLSENSEPSPAFEADEAHEDVLLVGSKSSPAVEADEALEEDVLSENSEPSPAFEADEDPEEDVVSVGSQPSSAFEGHEAPKEDILSVGSEPSHVFGVDETHGDDAHGDDVLSADVERPQRESYQMHRLEAGIASPELGVSYPTINTAGREVSLVEQQTVSLLVQEPESEDFQEVNVEIKQAIDTMSPDADLTSGGTEVVQEFALHHDILDPRLRNHLATPDATQRIHASSQLSPDFLRSLNENQDLLTPRPTQDSSTDPLKLNASLHQQRSSLLEKLKELKTSSATRSQVRSESEASSAISPWFAPKRSSQIAPRSASSDEGDRSGVESDHSDSESDLDNEGSEDSEDSEAAVDDDLQKISSGHVSTSTQPLSPPTGLRTSLSYFAPLASLESHFSSKLDVIAIVITSTRISRARSGPRDYHVNINLADPSTTTSSNVLPTAVSIFRPFEQALPLAQPGDAVLLRDFKVQRRKKRTVLLSTNSSAWAVFRAGEEAQIRGPPVEYGAAERGFVRGLRDWWATLAEEVKGKLRKEAPKDKVSHEGKGKWVDSRHELRDGTTYTDVPAEERNAIHELRDGTTYVDEGI